MNTADINTGRLFMIGIPGSELDDETKRLLETVDPLSIIFFGRNIVNPQQLAGLISDITAFMGRKPVFAVDQEGGIVTRLTKGFTVMPGPMALAQAGGETAAYEAAFILGTEMKAVGIDWDLAPVVDINRNPMNRGIGIRSFGTRKEEVISCAQAFVKGLSEAGVLSCLKHFPGLGGASVDPHIDLPVLDISREELFNTDIQPFLDIDCPCWMPTHIYVPSIQSRKEAVTVSSEVLTGIVRNKLGFDGLLLADDLNMGGVANSSSTEQLVINTFRAGMDILSICEGTEKQINAFNSLNDAVGKDEHLYRRYLESLERINSILSPFEDSLNQDTGKIGIAENASKAAGLSGRSIKCIKEEETLPLLSSIENIFSMKRRRLVMVEEEGQGLFYAAVKAAELSDCPLLEINSETATDETKRSLLKAAEGKINLIFTENAYLDDNISNLITALAEASKTLYLIALRNPWDADIAGIRNAWCSYGYTPAQQKAVISFLIGEKEV